MSDYEIIGKAIQKAIDNGWKKPYWADEYKQVWGMHYAGLEIRKDGQDIRREADYLKPDFYFNNIIFNHDFARALWRDLPRTIAHHIDENGQQRDGQVILEWQYHLQQMVIAEDPIKYLGENLDD